ncbi:MAG: CaiB/BaiF CoA transferase family protein [Desulfobacteraceae bacterium]
MITAQSLPPNVLNGCTVLDLSTLITGPYCSSLLGDMGAEVIKVEMPNGGDGVRHLGQFVQGESTIFLSVNRNKKGMTLALNRPEARDILDRIIARSDVIVENFRPDIRKQYGLDYERVRRVRPDIVYLSVTAFGEQGPYHVKPGTDHVFQALSGIMSISGEPGQGPVRVGVPIADMTAALYSAFGVMTALLHRERTGKGQLVCINLLDAAMSLQNTHVTEYFITGKEPVPCGNDSPFAYPVGVFPTRDGHIAISAYNDKFWQRLCEALELGHLLRDPRFSAQNQRFDNRAELRPLLNERFVSADTAHWLAILENKDIPCGPVHSYNSLFKDPQVIHNGLDRDLPHTSLGTVRTLGNPVRLHRTPAKERTAAPLLGEHTDAVLLNVGYTALQIRNFRSGGII